MQAVNVTDLRNHLPKYLSCVQKGAEILVTSHGQVMARIVPPVDVKQEARKKIRELRKHCQVGDVVSPIGDEWEAEK